MSKYTKEDIIRMVEEEGVDFIRMQFTDIFGQAKNVAITASQIQKAVNNQISIDGSSIEGFTRIHESDQYLYPDLDTFTILSWYEQKAVCILLTLLHLGIKNIRLGPSLPAFLSPNILNFLVENYGIAPISTPEEDLKALLGK